MGRRHWIRWVAVMAVPFFMAACAGKQGSTPSDMTAGDNGTAISQPGEQGSDAALVNRQTQQRIEAEKLVQKRKSEKATFVAQDVHFGFDSSVLSPEALSILVTKVAWLKQNPKAAITIEGHCDERGTREYNLALGDRRAKSAKKFLVDSGISSDRIATISYGEERPMAAGTGDNAWARNRRAHFVIR